MQASKNLPAILFLFFIQPFLNAQQWPMKEWPVSTPQSQSMNADSLKAFDEAIASGKYGYVDGMVVTRHGKPIAISFCSTRYRSLFLETYTHRSC